jgi:hypothetical protein
VEVVVTTVVVVGTVVVVVTAVVVVVEVVVSTVIAGQAPHNAGQILTTMAPASASVHSDAVKVSH